MKKKALIAAIALAIACIPISCTNSSDNITEIKDEMMEKYGVNQEIVGEYQKENAVVCKNGIFVGSRSDAILSFKGIPYAKAPIGDLRWKSPEEPDNSNKVYEAYYYGASPIQSEWPSEVGSYYPQGEDCLNLNIWLNTSNDETNKPVMVFFHGGSYGWGATADPMYDAANMVAKFDDIIIVTVEYRLGFMGFIDLSSVEGGESYLTSGNLGLLDQVCALKWIHDNITGFGGDPNNVTIWGESAGGGSVSLLPLIKGTEGLFHRVIAESGSINLTYSREECKKQTELLLEKTGCKNMQDLLALSTEALMEVAEEISDYNNFPMRDGIVLPENLYEAYKHINPDIDMLLGTNADETRYWINEMGYYTDLLSGKTIYTLAMPILFENNLKVMSDEDGTRAKQFVESLSDKRIWNLTEFYNEILFRIPAIRQAEIQSENGGNVYMYYWRYPSADKEIGACHAVELAYVFNNFDETIYTGENIDVKLAENVQNMWVNFARCGNPSTADYSWDTYNLQTRKTMILDSEIYMESDLNGEKREALEPLLKYYLNGCYSQLSLAVPSVYKYIAVVIATLALIVCAIILIINLYKKRGRKSRNNYK